MTVAEINSEGVHNNMERCVKKNPCDLARTKAREIKRGTNGACPLVTGEGEARARKHYPQKKKEGVNAKMTRQRRLSYS